MEPQGDFAALVTESCISLDYPATSESFNDICGFALPEPIKFWRSGKSKKDSINVENSAKLQKVLRKRMAHSIGDDIMKFESANWTYCNQPT
jgi:hypothetical protein